MNARFVLVSAALCAGLLAGCDKTKEPASKPTAGVQNPAGSPTVSIPKEVPPQSPPSAAERKDGAPIQGQVDPKQPEQRRDFETKKGTQ